MHQGHYYLPMSVEDHDDPYSPRFCPTCHHFFVPKTQNRIEAGQQVFCCSACSNRAQKTLPNRKPRRLLPRSAQDVPETCGLRERSDPHWNDVKDAVDSAYERMIRQGRLKRDFLENKNKKEKQ